jgi:hypothetical protein
VVLAGLRGMEGYAKLMVDSFIKFSLADHRGSEIVYAALPGEALLSDEGKRSAKRLAQALIEGVPKHQGESSVPRCNICGGDTFRFLEDGNVRCMVCSSGGSYAWQNDALHITTVRGGHSVFFTSEDAKAHFDFLRSMKDTFLSKRKELKAAAQEYHDIGEWIRPSRE